MTHPLSLMKIIIYRSVGPIDHKTFHKKALQSFAVSSLISCLGYNLALAQLQETMWVVIGSGHPGIV